MLETLKLKYFQGKQYIADIENAPMREQFRGFPILKQGRLVDEDVCPTGALKTTPLSIDMGKCTMCGACKCDAIQFTNYYKLSSTQRESLIITESFAKALTVEVPPKKSALTAAITLTPSLAFSYAKAC
jgi:hypothetical protein